MPLQNCYLAVQRLNVTDPQWNMLVVAMKAKGENQDPNPVNRCHWREYADGTIYIFHALFDSENVDVGWFKNWLSVLFGIDVGLIGEATGYNIYGRFSTLSYLAINRFRIGVFGFVQGQGWPSFAESQAAVLKYLVDNDWDTDGAGGD